MPLRSENGDRRYLFVLDLSADGYGAKELAMSAIANARVWHHWLGHSHAQPFQLGYGDLIGCFTPVVIGGQKYVSKGGEYTGEEFRQYCLETGVIQEFAATNTPQQIGVCERLGRTLFVMVRYMLADSGFPSSM